MATEQEINNENEPIIEEIATLLSQMDLTLFKKEGNILSADACPDILSCLATKRLMIALQYFELLIVDGDKEQNMEIFIEFVNEVYAKVIDDYTHFMTAHGDKLIEIKQAYFGNNGCSMNKCQFTQRHFVSTADKETFDQNNNFYVELFDALHFLLHHTIATGFRLPNEQIKQNDDTSIVDAEFARIQKAVRSTDALTKTFERISPQSNGKFNLKMDADNGDTTAMDELFAFMIDNGMSTQKVDKTKKFLQNEQFDTDCLNEQGLENISDEECKQWMRDFIKMIKS